VNKALELVNEVRLNIVDLLLTGRALLVNLAVDCRVLLGPHRVVSREVVGIYNTQSRVGIIIDGPHDLRVVVFGDLRNKIVLLLVTPLDVLHDLRAVAVGLLHGLLDGSPLGLERLLELCDDCVVRVLGPGILLLTVLLDLLNGLFEVLLT